MSLHNSKQRWRQAALRFGLLVALTLLTMLLSPVGLPKSQGDLYLRAEALGPPALAADRQAGLAGAEEQTLVSLINNYRASRGLSSLSVSGTLTNAAVWMSQDMATKDYFSHTDSLGRDPFQRMADFGYSYNNWMGENLAAAPPDAATVLQLWTASPTHNAVLLNPNFQVVGIGRAYNAASTYGWYWAADFGGQGAPPPPPPPPQPQPQVEEPLTPPQNQPRPASPTTPTSQARQEQGPFLPQTPPSVPDWTAIMALVLPSWLEVTVIGPEQLLLPAFSYLAEQHLALGNVQPPQ
ncbi:MAG TPA: CAP domain-containing protein [Dehalococcoidia bacterium]|nr:CAP domain-containing protein [Dehalococcoidia bacterium]